MMQAMWRLWFSPRSRSSSSTLGDKRRGSECSIVVRGPMWWEGPPLRLLRFTSLIPLRQRWPGLNVMKRDEATQRQVHVHDVIHIPLDESAEVAFLAGQGPLAACRRQPSACRGRSESTLRGSSRLGRRRRA